MNGTTTNIVRDTRFEVDLDCLLSNFRDLRSILDTDIGLPALSQCRRPASCGKRRIAVVLKADAYGHGAEVLAPVLHKAGADLIAVATLSEAIEIRRMCSDAEILVMGHTPECYFPAAIAGRITLTLFDAAQAQCLSDAAHAANYTARIHIKLDTGMNRLGMKIADNPVREISAIAGLPSLCIVGMFTHLALRDRASDMAQFEAFSQVSEALAARGIGPLQLHICDSIGMMRYPEFRLDMVRVGAALFGVRPMRCGPEYDAFSFPAPGTFVTKISRIRFLPQGEMVSYDDSWVSPAGGTNIATLPVGYADGYPRRFSNKSHVLIRGRSAPVVGLVCMDQMMVDLGAIPEAEEGDQVILLGGRGEHSISYMEASSWGEGNRNELLTSIGRRVPRVYYSGGAIVASWDRLLDNAPSLGKGDIA